MAVYYIIIHYYVYSVRPCAVFAIGHAQCVRPAQTARAAGGSWLHEEEQKEKNYRLASAVPSINPLALLT